MNSNLIPMRFSSKYTAIRISLGAALIAAAAQAQTVPAARTHTWWHDTGAGLRPYTANAKKLPLISVKGNKFVDPQGATVLFRGLSISDRKSTRLNSSHLGISYAVFCLKKK